VLRDALWRLHPSSASGFCARHPILDVSQWYRHADITLRGAPVCPHPTSRKIGRASGSRKYRPTGVPGVTGRQIVDSMSELRRQLKAMPGLESRLRQAIHKIGQLEPVKARRLSALLSLYVDEDSRLLIRRPSRINFHNSVCFDQSTETEAPRRSRANRPRRSTTAKSSAPWTPSKRSIRISAALKSCNRLGQSRGRFVTADVRSNQRTYRFCGWSYMGGVAAGVDQRRNCLAAAHHFARRNLRPRYVLFVSANFVIPSFAVR